MWIVLLMWREIFWKLLYNSSEKHIGASVNHHLDQNHWLHLLSGSHVLWIILYLIICSILCLLLEFFSRLEFYILREAKLNLLFMSVYNNRHITSSVHSFNFYPYTDDSQHILCSFLSLNLFDMDVQEVFQTALPKQNSWLSATSPFSPSFPTLKWLHYLLSLFDPTSSDHLLFIF